jgi:2'-5' RNA ligase
VENWHITLAFYGEKPDGLVDELASNLDQVAFRQPPFELALAGAGIFRHEIGWIGVNDPAEQLARLATVARGSWAGENQHAQNRFHVTVSRSKRRSNLADTMAALSIYRGPAWVVDSISLYRSDLGEGVSGHPLYSSLHSSTLSSASA